MTVSATKELFVNVLLILAVFWFVNDSPTIFVLSEDAIQLNVPPWTSEVNGMFSVFPEQIFPVLELVKFGIGFTVTVLITVSLLHPLATYQPE